MTTFGIEIEVSDISIPTAQAVLNRAQLGWRVKPDGTRHVSAEAVSPILQSADLPQARIATRALRVAGATVNKQCGLHVHLGADEYGHEGLANLVWNYNLAHATIGALVAKSRLNNRFCVPVSLAELDAQVERVRNGSIRNIGLNGRYRSLNLDAYAQHGTVEFRLHHGTLNGKKITAWSEFVSALATFSKAGARLEHADGWSQPTDKLQAIGALLDLLVAVNTLKEDTAQYLKARADELEAR